MTDRRTDRQMDRQTEFPLVDSTPVRDRVKNYCQEFKARCQLSMCQGLFQAELYIEDLSREDEGEYSCQVLVKDF